MAIHSNYLMQKHQYQKDKVKLRVTQTAAKKW